MIRWLKDKKKEKRTNSSSQNDFGKEDDYGFGTEKSATKSPSSRRQLPPTPATPEEKSPHIYEEIPDLPLCCMPDSEKALLQSKFSKYKNGSTSAMGAISESSRTTLKASASEKDDISPYMVVPVDNEVRQTPTDFHRNGTPEVHCDVIVKDTHCEILLTRKPKVGAFRLDNTAPSVAGENGGDRRNIRNNTHFCSRDWRASADVNSTGNTSSAFSVTSSAFSSSTASKIHSGGASSSLTPGNVSGNNPLETCEESASGDSGEKGVITYSSASNFIPRSTKLIFNPLFGKNPCKEAFGVDLSEGLSSLAYSSIKDDETGVSGVSFTSSREQHTGSKCVTYASIHSTDVTDPSPESRVTYASIEDQHLGDTKIKPNYSFDDQVQSQFNTKQPNYLSNPSNDNSGFGCTTRTGIIRPVSPSDSSNCIYALVTFPTETKHYNTIADIMSSENAEYNGDDFTTNSLGVIYTSVNGASDSNVVYLPSSSEISDARKATEVGLSGEKSFHFKDTQRKVNQVSCFDFSERASNNNNVNRICRDSDRVICTETAGQTEMRNSQNGNKGTEQGNCAKRRSEFPRPSDLQLEFCMCSDEHSSSCGCPDAKHNQDDDVTSVAGALSDCPNSCRSCGRLIRQITYSESYSDETCEHVYASRLLIRTGRRFSSPDITFSETSASEFHDIQNYRNQDFPYAFSRDDSWASIRNSDIIPPSYSAAAGTDILNSFHDVPQLEERNPAVALRRNTIKKDSVGQLHSHRSNGGYPEQTNYVVSKVAPAIHAISCPTNRNSAVTTVQHPNDVNTENNSVLDVSAIGRSTLSQNADQSRSVVEPVVDPTRKQDASLMLEPKGSAFIGLLSKFSRTKSSKSAKSDPPGISTNACTVSGEKPRQSDVPRCDKDLEEIPEKNTKKLSKFFQRLSSKEPTKAASDCITSIETDDQNAFMPKDVKSTEKCEKGLGPQSHISATKSHNHLLGSANVLASLCDQLSLETVSDPSKDIPSTGTNEASNNKSQFKTDSGDTCYEYDISTSSEGEQTGYDYFLSKVKKTLNLEHETQHITESSAVRRKRLCKRCKQEGLYSTIDDVVDSATGGDGLCPHLAAKLGDLRAIFEDLVVDQRAAILDCLTDFTSNPYSIRGHSQDVYCRECGCEILTSDSESLTTVYSLLSQQFRMTSPNGQTLSCDSDEGTMADNSGESADDDYAENLDNNINNNKIHYDGNSSGYDEPKGKNRNLAPKPKKKERRDKKSAHAHVVSKEAGIQEIMSNLALTIDGQEVAACSLNFGDLSTETPINKHQLKDAKENTSSFFSDNHRKSTQKNNASTPLSTHLSETAGLYFSHGTDSKDDNLDHSRMCDISRSRASLITDKVLQDIYAPLPSKALSLLTSRNHNTPSGLSCTCGRGLQASLATVTAHLAAEKTITSPAGCIKRDCFLKPSSASLTLCDSDKKDGVVPVQKHFQRDRKNSSEGELYILRDRKDIDGPKDDRRTMGAHNEIEAFAYNGCSPARKNAESNDCLTSQTKAGIRTFTNERSPVSGRNGSPLKKRPPEKHPYEHGIKNNGVLDTSSNQEKDKCAQISLPHTTKDSAGLAFTAESMVHNSLDHPLIENVYTEVCEGSSVELKTEAANITYSRKHRLGLVALDLLPESTVDGDSIQTEQIPKKLTTQPKRSGVIEKMAKLFENNSISTGIDKSNSNQEMNNTDLTTKINNRSMIKSAIIDQYNSPDRKSSKTSQLGAHEKIISSVPEIAANSIVSIPRSKRSLSGTTSCSLIRQDNLCGRSESSNLNLKENPVTSDKDPLTVSKPRRSSSRSRQCKDGDRRSMSLTSDNECGRLKNNESQSVKEKPGKAKLLTSYLTETRLTKQRSPTPSSSSVSSSSSSKKKSSHARHKVSKKSYHRKRSKHRSAQRKNGHGKEERTYYYFSSDFSDIDVVELENSDPYSAGMSRKILHNKKLSTSSKKRSVSSDDMLTNSLENTTVSSLPSQNSKNTEGADGGSCEQEIYSMPSSSSDVISRKNGNETSISSQPSPEMAKLRKMKNTDVYRSRKSNNKLLSDLIIRNYDMQVYGNI